jgi:hypothetical protein
LRASRNRRLIRCLALLHARRRWDARASEAVSPNRSRSNLAHQPLLDLRNAASRLEDTYQTPLIDVLRSEQPIGGFECGCVSARSSAHQSMMRSGAKSVNISGA